MFAVYWLGISFLSFSEITFLDCTLRDGGYYNNWDFSPDLIKRYMEAARLAGVDVLELGFRFIDTAGFKGPCAFASDDFITSLGVPEGMAVSVMLNASDLFKSGTLVSTLETLFPRPAAETPVSLVRIACHAREYLATLPAADWLSARGYRVGLNVMQITDRTRDEIVALAQATRGHPVEVFYFADSMGSMTPEQAREIIRWIRGVWDGPIGVHTHDNIGLALENMMTALDAGATWLDGTVTGMGRGPGNARTEELALELADRRPERATSMSAMIDLVAEDFGPMKARYGWGTNPFYYLSGKYGIHPTYVQTMLGDSRFTTDDILGVLELLRRTGGGKSFKREILLGARQDAGGESGGSWSPRPLLERRDVLMLGNGDSIVAHRQAIEDFIRRYKPLVLGLNTVTSIDETLIDLRLACHPLRLLADAATHAKQRQPLVVPVAALPDGVREMLGDKAILDYGMSVKDNVFLAGETACALPSRLVIAYGLAVATAGCASQVYLAGFDGFPQGDPRFHEMQDVFELYNTYAEGPPLTSLTDTRYSLLSTQSVYGLIR